MAVYHCPQCQQELTRGDVPTWARWVVGPIFGLFWRPFLCGQHGEVLPELMIPEERQKVATQRWTAGFAVTAISIAVLYLILKGY